MYHNVSVWRVATAAVLLILLPAPAEAEQFWSVDSGSMTLMPGGNTLADRSISIADADASASSRDRFAPIQLEVASLSGLGFEVVDKGITSIFGRYLHVSPGVQIVTDSGGYTVFDLIVMHQWLSDAGPGATAVGEPPALILHDVKTGFDWRTHQLTIFSRRVTISQTLANELKNPELAGVSVGSTMIKVGTRWVAGDSPPPAAEPPETVPTTPAGGGDPLGDMTFCQLYNLRQYGRLDDIVGLAVGTTSWNVGDGLIDWYGSPNPLHPFIIMNMYRLKDDRFEQIGQSWAKHGFCALDNAQCGGTCWPPTGCDTLSLGCTDTYSSPLNASRGSMGPKHEINPWTGHWDYFDNSHFLGGYPPHDPIEHRIQVHDADLDPLENLGATYYVESFYAIYDDVNAMNSVSWKIVDPIARPPVCENGICEPEEQTTCPVDCGCDDGGPCDDEEPDFWVFDMTDHGDPPNIGWAIDAWIGAEQTVLAEEVPLVEFESPDGRCVLGYKATDLGSGLYRYEYALLNVDMDRAVKSFTISLGSGVALTNIEFHGVDSHDVPFSNDEWTYDWTPEAITWSTTLNPLRWGTLYNFRFDANAQPNPTYVTLGMYKPGSPNNVTGTTIGPGIPDCNDNGIPDNCDIDCNPPGVTCGLSGCGESTDCNVNGIPDECEVPCGDGSFDIGCSEECDDGNTYNNDDCLITCEEASCGDGFVWNEVSGTEECDDGDANDQNDCTQTCQNAECGDGIVWNEGTGTEECDDLGESTTCDNDCTVVECGDGTLNITAGEECDDGNTSNNDDCLITCEEAGCGDGFVWDEGTGTEECDDLGESPTCDDDCTVVECGDGTLNITAGEECDDGLGNSDTEPDACRTDCTSAGCGDGVVDDGEQCDDGNMEPDDGCDSNCHVYAGDHCIVPFEASLGSNFGTNTQFGPDDRETSCQPNSNNDAWFEYTAPCTATHLINTNGSLLEPMNDTALSIYDACDGGELACDDNGGGGLLSGLTFDATTDTTYYIRVAGVGDNMGEILLNISTVGRCIQRRDPDRVQRSVFRRSRIKQRTHR